MSQITSWFTGEDQNELCPSLSFQQRVYGFLVTMLIGAILSVISWFAVLRRDWTLFAMLVTASNLTAIGGSCFLAGPLKQVKRMFEETRLVATIVYLSAIVLTVVAAVVAKSPPFCIVCCIIQYLAMIWYGLSYIPYARNMVKNCLKGAVSV